MDHRTIAAIEERIDRNGEVVVPIDLDQVKAAVRKLVEEEGIEALAVSFVWSFANRTHEDQAVAAAKELYPDLPVVSGAESSVRAELRGVTHGDLPDLPDTPDPEL